MDNTGRWNRMKAVQKYQEHAREIAVYGDYDCIIIGGGCAGFAAAVAAGRNGIRTLIIERFAYFGGTATASLMANINGFRNQVEPDTLQTTKGIGEELILNLKEMNGLGKSPYSSKQYEDTKGNLTYSFAVDTEKLKYIMLKMVVDAGVDILFHTYFSDTIMQDNKVKGIIIENKSGRQAVYGKIIIDASGDGDVAYKAGVPFWQTKSDENVRLNDGMMYKIAGFTEDNNVGGCVVAGTMVLWGPTPGPIDSTDADALTKGEIKTRLEVFAHLEKKKLDNPALAEAKLIETGPLLGIRQTRFFEGLYKITGEDVIEGRSFDDSIAMASSPIINYYGYRHFLTHEGYEIPYRCLLPQNVLGLLVVGRCMSSDQRAYESWRAMGHILAIGEAAGTAAAFAAKAGIEPQDVDIKILQNKLIAQGAEIGQGRG